MSKTYAQIYLAIASEMKVFGQLDIYAQNYKFVPKSECVILSR